jgi:hypothetical protein
VTGCSIGHVVPRSCGAGPECQARCRLPSTGKEEIGTASATIFLRHLPLTVPLCSRSESLLLSSLSTASRPAGCTAGCAARRAAFWSADGTAGTKLGFILCCYVALLARTDRRPAVQIATGPATHRQNTGYFFSVGRQGFSRSDAGHKRAGGIVPFRPCCFARSVSETRICSTSPASRLAIFGRSCFNRFRLCFPSIALLLSGFLPSSCISGSPL